MRSVALRSRLKPKTSRLASVPRQHEVVQEESAQGRRQCEDQSRGAYAASFHLPVVSGDDSLLPVGTCIRKLQLLQLLNSYVVGLFIWPPRYSEQAFSEYAWYHEGQVVWITSSLFWVCLLCRWDSLDLVADLRLIAPILLLPSDTQIGSCDITAINSSLFGACVFTALALWLHGLAFFTGPLVVSVQLFSSSETV